MRGNFSSDIYVRKYLGNKLCALKGDKCLFQDFLNEEVNKISWGNIITGIRVNIKTCELLKHTFRMTKF